MFNPQYFSHQYFPPVWFAPGDESHLLPHELQQGGIGHGKSKSGKKKRWIERDGKILVFDDSEQAELFIESEKAKKNVKLKKKKAVEIKHSPPVYIIDKQEIKRLSIAYDYREKLYHADQIGDISRIIAIYKELQRREEDDIELLLMVA